MNPPGFEPPAPDAVVAYLRSVAREALLEQEKEPEEKPSRWSLPFLRRKRSEPSDAPRRPTVEAVPAAAALDLQNAPPVLAPPTARLEALRSEAVVANWPETPAWDAALEPGRMQIDQPEAPDAEQEATGDPSPAWQDLGKGEVSADSGEYEPRSPETAPAEEPEQPEPAPVEAAEATPPEPAEVVGPETVARAEAAPARLPKSSPAKSIEYNTILRILPADDPEPEPDSMPVAAVQAEPESLPSLAEEPAVPAPTALRGEVLPPEAFPSDRPRTIPDRVITMRPGIAKTAEEELPG